MYKILFGEEVNNNKEGFMSVILRVIWTETADFFIRNRDSLWLNVEAI